MKTIIRGALVAALTLAAGAAAAEATRPGFVNISEMAPGYTYYNRPGADIEAHDKDLIDCAVEAARTRSIDDQINNGAGQGLVGSLVGQAFGSAYNRATFAAALENCMVVKNWRVVRIPDEEGKAVLKLGTWAVREKVMAWVGLDQPYGEVVRVWGNDAANAVNQRFEVRPARKVDGSLSLVAISEQAYAPAPAATFYDNITRVKLDKRWPLKPLKPTEFGRAPADGGIMIVHVRGMSFRNGIGVTFMRMGPDPLRTAASVDNAPDLFFAFVPLLGAKKEGKYIALATPPGRWRIAAMGIMPTVNFCLGAPALEVKAGDVVYAGSFDMSAPQMGPNLDLAGPLAWLGGAPQAASLKAAEYTNGWTAPCGDNSIYALEIPGAAFREGYAWGGAFRPAAPATTAPAAAPAPPAVAPNGGR